MRPSEVPYIESPSNPRVKELSSLKDGKGPFFLAEGKHLVEEALRHGEALELF